MEQKQGKCIKLCCEWKIVYFSHRKSAALIHDQKTSSCTVNGKFFTLLNRKSAAFDPKSRMLGRSLGELY